MVFQRLAYNVRGERAGFLVNKVEEFLADVHTFLQLPRSDIGLDAGGNYSTELVLFAVIDGVAKTIYPIDPRPSPESFNRNDPPFITLLTDWYPWDEEPTGRDAVIGRRAALDLYYCYRNPLTHALGRAPVDPSHRRAHFYSVSKYDPPLTEEEIVDLERAQHRPVIRELLLPPTIKSQGAWMSVVLEALYWGVRRTIERVTSVEKIVQEASSRMPTSKDYE